MESYLMHKQLWPRLLDDTGIDYQWRIVSLVQADFQEPELPGLQETADAFLAADGFEASILDREQLLDLEPRLSPKVLRGVIARGNASLDSYQYTLALARAAEQLGASVRPGVVKGLESSKGRVTGVVLEDGVLPCESVVLANGPWSR
jgi:glycine/D-amino acid oxidase-like deaminating enzyme